LEEEKLRKSIRAEREHLVQPWLGFVKKRLRAGLEVVAELAYWFAGRVLGILQTETSNLPSFSSTLGPGHAAGNFFV
jgi:hypothetical protein